MPLRTPRHRIAAALAGAVLATVATSTAPALAEAPATDRYLYVPNMATNSMSTIDLATRTVTGTRPVGDHPLITRTTADGSKTYVDNLGIYPGKLTAVDNTSGRSKDIPLDSIPFAIVLSPDDTRLYAVTPALTVNVIDTADDSVIERHTLPLLDITAGIEISPDGKTLYLSTVAGSILAIDAASGEIVKPVQPCNGILPAWLGISRDGTRLYSLNWFSDDTTVFDTRTWTMIARIDNGVPGGSPQGAKPAIMKESPDGSKLYITNYAGRNVQVVDTRTWQTITRIPTTGLAMGIDFGADGTGYITDWGPGSLDYETGIIATGFFVAVFFGGPVIADPGPGTLHAFDPRTDRILWSVPVGNGASVFSFGS